MKTNQKLILTTLVSLSVIGYLLFTLGCKQAPSRENEQQPTIAWSDSNEKSDEFTLSSPQKLPKFFKSPRDNFHTVEQGKCYRCRQLNGKSLARYLALFSIKTVINLRGTNEDKTWYQEEKAAVAQSNTHLVDLQMSANRLPTQAEINQLLTVFDSYPKPFLIHCRRGADRTGLACALYAMEHMNQPKEQALRQLSSRYKHYKMFTPSMSKFIHLWQDRNWLMTQYQTGIEATAQA